MSRSYCIALLAIIGFFLTPPKIYACGKKSDNIEHSSSKETASKAEKKDCCKKGHSDNDNQGCGGKCGNSSCHCPTACINYTLPSSVQFNRRNIFHKNVIFYYNETYISSGFHSIWLPPKIG